MDQKAIYPFGTILKVIYPLNQNKATFNARCAVVDGQKIFPEYYKQLVENFVLSDIDEFVAIVWHKKDTNYNGAIDGYYHSARFSIDDDQTDFRLQEKKEIKNNEGREFCYLCDSPTKKIIGFNSFYTVCSKCGK